MSLSEKEFYQLTISINKALNPTEAPLKIKHARSVIISSHRTKEAKSFWRAVTRQPLMENQFTAWKFCHLLHKIVREGHEVCIKHTQSHKKFILEMGKLWGHLQDGIGNCIEAYSKLIVTKLDFHEKNPFFPGNLLLDFREISKYSVEDINFYFHLCVEIFDYLDDIVDVQAKVFTSINTYRMTSMTPQGQCRLAPLVTLIQDSNPLYDLSVRIMFKLHDGLPNDILVGHRDRFIVIFNQLKSFYGDVRPLQYFADLIQVPNLPENAPNFASQVDFGSYIPPIVVVQPELESKTPVDNLVDMSNAQHTNCNNVESDYILRILTLENSLKQKYDHAQQLEMELVESKNAFSVMKATYHENLQKLREEICTLNDGLTSAKELSTNMRIMKDDLELKLQVTPNLLQKVSEEEEKAKASEEKFNKLKSMYTQIRDEHITLLRQHGETKKQLNKIKNENLDLISEKESLIIRLEETTKMLKSKEESKACETMNFELKMKEVCSQYDAMRLTIEETQTKYKEMQENVRDEIEQNEKLTTENKILSEYKMKFANLEKEMKENTGQLTKDNLHLKGMCTDLEERCNKRMREASHIEATLREQINKDDVKSKKLLEHVANNDDEGDSKLPLTKMLDVVLGDKNKQLASVHRELDTVRGLLLSNAKEHKSYVRDLFETIIDTLTRTFQRLDPNELWNSNDVSNILDTFKVTVEALPRLYADFSAHESDKEFARAVIILCDQFWRLKQSCLIIYGISTDFKNGRVMLLKMNAISEKLVAICRDIVTVRSLEFIERESVAITTHLDEIGTVLDNMIRSTNSPADLDELVENELSEMDKAIEEAADRIAQMLSSSRNIDTGIKLEVNEKILDACTNLMKSIKVLIQKSKVLQEEIVLLGRGSATAKEFYKRNSQWSEGLISASKNVAKGANMLVDAANKAVSSESGQSFEIIVTAQEIAACTAQLVIASKVKAPRESQKLEELRKASRKVSEATGAVVATVKDCNQHIEVMQEMDLTKLTTHQAKTMEMDIHVKVLELERALQIERLRLSEFRRRNYQNIEN